MITGSARLFGFGSVQFEAGFPLRQNPLAQKLPADSVHFSRNDKTTGLDKTLLVDKKQQALASLIATMKEKYKGYQGKTVILFYSGGMDTSFLTRVFAKEIGAKVYTVSFNVGEDPRELSKIKTLSQQLGAIEHIHEDVQEEFANQYCAKAILANGLYQDAHPISSSLSRPLMIKHGVALAKKYGCKALIHGSSPWQNNVYRFNNALYSLSKSVQPLVPVMDLNIPRELEDLYLRQHRVEIRSGEDKLYSADYNLWAPEAEDGQLSQINQVPSESLFRLTTDPEKAPREAQYVDIEFKQGLPKAFRVLSKAQAEGHDIVVPEHLPNSDQTIKDSLLGIINQLNAVGGAYGVGRYDALEHRPSGLKEREVHEAPAATMLIQAHLDLERTVVEHTRLKQKREADREWTDMVCSGSWFDPRKKDLEKLIERVNKQVTGVVRLKLLPGSAHIVARASCYSLDEKNVSFPTLFPGGPAYPDSDFVAMRNAGVTAAERVKKRKRSAKKSF